MAIIESDSKWIQVADGDDTASMGGIANAVYGSSVAQISRQPNATTFNTSGTNGLWSAHMSAQPSSDDTAILSSRSLVVKFNTPLSVTAGGWYVAFHGSWVTGTGLQTRLGPTSVYDIPGRMDGSIFAFTASFQSSTITWGNKPAMKPFNWRGANAHYLLHQLNEPATETNYSMRLSQPGLLCGYTSDRQGGDGPGGDPVKTVFGVMIMVTVGGIISGRTMHGTAAHGDAFNINFDPTFNNAFTKGVLAYSGKTT